MRRLWLAIPAAAVLLAGAPALASAGASHPAPVRSYLAPAAAGAHPLVRVHLAHPFRTHPLQAGTKFSAGAKFNNVNSNNWSGFAAYKNHFRYVSTTYTIPSVNCAASPDGSFDSQWVGLDGYGTSTVEQTGTFAQCSGGTPSYFAFYEMFPSPSVSLTGVSPGDSITADVYYNSSDKKWNLTLTDNTTGAAFNESLSCPASSTCNNGSAEVVSEVPNGGPPNATLNDYGTVGFTQIALTDTASHHYNFFSPYWSVDKIFEVDSGNNHTMQNPSKLEGSQSGLGGGSGNQAFTDTAVASS